MQNGYEVGASAQLFVKGEDIIRPKMEPKAEIL